MTIREVFEDVYEVLVKTGGASPMWEEDFVNYHTMKHSPEARSCGTTTEFRFMGKLGMGGKFWATLETFHVSYYSEDETEERKALRITLNQELAEFHARWRLLASRDECAAQ